jgi:hypothetical protein
MEKIFLRNPGARFHGPYPPGTRQGLLSTVQRGWSAGGSLSRCGAGHGFIRNLVDPHEPPPLLTLHPGCATIKGMTGLIAPCEFTPGFSCFLGGCWGLRVPRARTGSARFKNGQTGLFRGKQFPAKSAEKRPKGIGPSRISTLGIASIGPLVVVSSSGSAAVTPYYLRPTTPAWRSQWPARQDYLTRIPVIAAPSLFLPSSLIPSGLKVMTSMNFRFSQSS